MSDSAAQACVHPDVDGNECATKDSENHYWGDVGHVDIALLLVVSVVVALSCSPCELRRNARVSTWLEE